MAEKLLTIDQVVEVTTLSKTEIGRRIEIGEFPKQIKLGPKRVAWVGSEVEAWIQATITKARGENE